MAIESNVVHGVLFVRLHGDLDHHGVERMRDEIESLLQDTAHRGLVLSLEGTDFMDSAGLGLILGRYKSVTQHHGKMALVGVNPALQKLFDLSGILKIVPLYESAEDALRAIKEAL